MVLFPATRPTAHFTHLHEKRWRRLLIRTDISPTVHVRFSALQTSVGRWVETVGVDGQQAASPGGSR